MSNGGDADFRKLTMLDARKSMHEELVKLIATAPAETKEVSIAATTQLLMSTAHLRNTNNDFAASNMKCYHL
jgi:hypothetical protein